jgi:hypothetical protein
MLEADAATTSSACVGAERLASPESARAEVAARPDPSAAARVVCDRPAMASTNKISVEPRAARMDVPRPLFAACVMRGIGLSRSRTE